MDKKLKLQKNLEAVRDALNNLVASPAQPQHQATLAQAKEGFTEAVKGLENSITPSQSSAIAAVGGTEFFDPLMAEKVNESISTNAMTPSVVRDFVKDLASRREAFLSTVEVTLNGLGNLGISGDGIDPGAADMAFSIPRDLFDNQLGAFTKELVFVSRMIAHFAEAANSDAESIKLETLSSSTPTVVIAASVGVILTIGKTVNNFLTAWEKIERIRKVRAEITDLGMKGKALDEFTDQINQTIKKVVVESTQAALANYKVDSGRKNELETALHQDIRRLYGQIERGLTIQFRGEPSKEANATDNKALEAVNRMSLEMHFPELVGQPMLLTPGEVLEGDLSKTASPSKSPKKSPRESPKREPLKISKKDGDTVS